MNFIYKQYNAKKIVWLGRMNRYVPKVFYLTQYCLFIENMRQLSEKRGKKRKTVI